MAYRRSLSIRSTLLARRFNPSFSYLSHGNDRSRKEELPPSGSKIDTYLEQRRSFGSCVNIHPGQFNGAFHGTGSTFAGSGLCLHRYVSTSSSQTADGAIFTDAQLNAEGVFTDAPMAAEAVLTDASVEAIASQAQGLSEVAIAAADSAFPVQILQYLIDGVHTFTGLNWWASVALTTLLIRGATIPFLINQLKSTAKLTMMRPKMEEIKEEMDNSNDPQATIEGQKKMQAMFKEHGVTPFTPLKGLLIQGPVFMSFFFAITNMTEKVPSFKTGGALWFTDLTIPDATYGLPILTGLSLLVVVECNMQEGLEGNPIANTMKKVSRGFALATVPLTMNFPQALFCYWITSNMFSLLYGTCLKVPRVKKALGIPDIPVPPPSKNTPNLSFMDTLRQAALKSATNLAKANAAAKLAKSASDEKSNSVDKKALTAATLSEELANLEKQYKMKKRLKKR